jgi:hypothetical protein
MRNLKKVLGLVLCLAMMLSIMVVGAGAAFVDQKDIDTKHQQAVDMCNALNIITGFENGKFMPNDNVTREQMAKMICVLDNGGKEPQLATGSTFTDVAADRWSNKYIEACASRGVVVGIGGGKFAPAGKVTATQAAKMLLVELGYDDDTQKYSGADWATKVNVDATKKGYYEDLEDIDVNAPLTREHAAQMIWNALQATEIEYKNTLTTDANGNLTATSTPQDKTHFEDGTNVDTTLLWDKYKGDVKEARLVEFNYDSNKQEWTYYFDGRIPPVKSSQNFTGLLGQKVKAAYDTSGSNTVKDAYGIFVTDSQVLLEGQFGSLPKMTNAADTSFKMDGVTYKLDGKLGTIPVYQFCPEFWTEYAGGTLFKTAGQEIKTGDTTASNITTWDAQKFTAVDYDGNGKIDFFMVVPFAVKEVNYVSSTQFSLKGDANKTDLEDVNAYDGMARSDYVVYTAAYNTADDTAVLTKADLVSGQITATDKPDAQIDGTWYTFDASYTKTNDACKAGNTLKDAVVVNNYIFDVDKIDHTAIDDFAVVIAVQSGAGNVNGNQAKLLFANGDKTVVNTDKNYSYVEASGSTPASGLKAGDLVTYSKNSDGDYILKKAVNTGNKYGYELEAAVTSVDKISNNSSKIGYINTAAVNDDAVIFVQYDSGSYKVISGSQLKAISRNDFSASATNNINSLVLGAKDGNVYNVEMAYISLGTNKLNDADTFYAYVTGTNEIRNADQQNVLSLSVWTKDGSNGPTTLELASSSTTIHKDGVNNGTVAAGDVIEYKLNSDGKISEILNIYDVDRTTAYQKELKTAQAGGTEETGIYGATVAISALAPTFQFSTDGTNVVTKTVRPVGSTVPADFFELDKDTAYIYIENDDHSGAEEATILTADKDGNTMLPNAFVVFDNTDGKVKLVVYDTDNRISEGVVYNPVAGYETENLAMASSVVVKYADNSGDDTALTLVDNKANYTSSEKIQIQATRTAPSSFNGSYTLKIVDGSTTVGTATVTNANGQSVVFEFAPTSALSNKTLTADNFQFIKN